MDFRSHTNDFRNQIRAYLERLRSTEGNSLTEVDLQLLCVQLRLLESEVSNRQHIMKTGRPDKEYERLLREGCKSSSLGPHYQATVFVLSWVGPAPK